MKRGTGVLMTPGAFEDEVAAAVVVGEPLVTVPFTEPGGAAVVVALAPNSEPRALVAWA